MASILKVNKLDPQSGTDLEIGTSGDTVTVPSGATLDISSATLTPPATLPASSGVNLTALNASNLGSGTVPAARLSGVGKILDWKNRNSTDTTVTVSSTSWTDSNITLTATPSSTDSRLYVMVSFYVNHSSSTGQGFGLKRAISGGVTTDQLGDATVGISYTYNTVGYDNGNIEHYMKFYWIDHPNTTSAVTYTVNGRREGGSGDAFNFGESNKPSLINILEINGAAGL